MDARMCWILKKFCFPRWEAVYSSDEEGEAGGAETQAVGGLFYMQLETLSWSIYLICEETSWVVAKFYTNIAWHLLALSRLVIWCKKNNEENLQVVTDMKRREAVVAAVVEEVGIR